MTPHPGRARRLSAVKLAALILLLVGLTESTFDLLTRDQEVGYERLTMIGNLLGGLLLFVALVRESRSVARAQANAIAADGRAAEAHRQLFEAIELVNDGFALYGADERLIQCNARYRDMCAPYVTVSLGMRFEDLIRDGALHGQYAGCDSADVEPWVAERLAQHRDPRGPREQRLSDGRWLRVDERRTTDGGSVALVTDITELKSRAEELTHKSDLLEATFASMTQGLLVWGPDGRFRACNRRYLELQDLPESLMTPKLTRFEMLKALAERGELGPGDPETLAASHVPVIHPEYRDRHVHTRPNGRVLEITANRMPDGSTLMTFADVTEVRRVEAALRESEDRFRKLSDAALDGILVHELGVIVDVNRAAAAMLGCQPEELIGESVASLMAPEDRAFAWQRMRDRDESPFEACCLRRDGSRMVVRGETRYVLYRGRTMAMVSVQDITEHRRVEAQLRLAKEQAEAANTAKSAFLRMISHEIRTPMNGVLGMLGLLLDGPMPEVQRSYAETARESAQALLTMLNDILDISKMEAGRLSLDSGRFDLADVVESVVELQAPRAYAKGIELATCVPAELPASLSGDAGRLRQVLLNLVGNAVKFTDHGGVAVTVAYDEPADGEHPPRRLRFEVADSGIGIPANARDALFTEFAQVHDRPDRRHEGAGLGLAISKRLVELMGGTMGFTSREVDGQDCGSLFWFTLPLSVEDAREPNSPGAGGALAGCRVLLLESDPLTRRAIADQIRSWGAVVAAPDPQAEGAAHPAEAAELVVAGSVASERLARALATDTSEPPRLLRLVPPIPPGRSPRAGDGATLVKPVRRTRLLAALGGPVAPAPAASVRPPVPDGAGRRILVAEDSPTNQIVAAALLRGVGYRVDIVGNGREALEAVRAEAATPDGYGLVLMDLAMPEMDGLTATRAVRALPPPAGTVPIIAMTADAMDSDRERCLAAGMNDHVAKPVDRAHLLETVARWARRSALVPVQFHEMERPAPSAEAPAQATPLKAAPDEVEGDVLEVVLDDVLDREVLEQLSQDLDPDLLAEVIREFVEETLARAERIAMGGADLTGLAVEAHTLKSTAGTFGARSLQAAARALELACRANAAGEIESLRGDIPRLTRQAVEAYRTCGYAIPVS